MQPNQSADELAIRDTVTYEFHGVYKPGNVKLKPSILKEGQDAVVAKYGQDAHFDLVFHGGSGSSVDEIHETLNYGVIKMNIDRKP